MIELLLGGLEPPKTPLITYVTETIQTETVIPELTVEEKIATNYYKCNESTQYIRRDTAECIDRPQYRASESRSDTKHRDTPVSTQNTSTAPAGWYPKGQCTWWVWTKRPVGRWNNASDWKWQAIRDGYTFSNTPVAGAIAWKYGHVAYVESVGDGTVTISEANYNSRGSIRTVTIPVDSYQYLY